MSEKKFKIGDKVRAVNRVGGCKVGDIREVVKELYEDSNHWIDDTRCEINFLNAFFTEDFELVQEEQKAMQITDDMILVTLGKLDEYARAHDHRIYGLPPYTKQTMDMIDIIKESLGILTERDKQIKQLQDIAEISKEQAEKLIEAGVVFGKGKEDN